MPTKTNAPLPADIEAGKDYLWCRCGLSHNMPLCDGKHQGTGKQPVVFTAEQTKTAYLCACSSTQSPPICDGSHCKIVLNQVGSPPQN